MEMIDRFQNALRQGTVSIPPGAQPALTADGAPIVVLGRDALVARLQSPSGSSLALRIPASGHGGADWPERYGALAETFPAGPMTARIPRDPVVQRRPLHDEDAPGVLMEWIDGPTLLQAVHRACLARNTAVLAALATAFRDAINDARSAGFRHGDPTADNLIIRPTGRIAFIDLDTAAWPGAPFEVAGRGTPGYRHPAGGAAVDTARDAFASLVIYSSLRLLASYPELRIRYGDQPEVHGGCLLFSAWDLADPLTSRLFAELERTSATRGPELETLRAACVQAPDETELMAAIPGLRPYQLGEDGRRDSRRWGTSSETSRRDGVLASFRTRLRGPESTSVVDDIATYQDEELTARWPARSGPGQPLSRPPAGEVGVAMWRERLRRAIEQEDEAAVARIWPEVERDPIGSTMALDANAVLGRGYDRRIALEARRRRDEAVLSLTEEAVGRGLLLSSDSRLHARDARERGEIRAELEQALASDDRQRLADLAVSGRLIELGETDREAIRTVLRALERPILERALESDDDALVLLAYDDELFGGSEALRPEERARIELARNREEWLRAVRRALKRRDAASLANAFAKPPPGAEGRLSEAERRRIYRLIERERALDQLIAAIKEDDEPAILVALNTVERVGARIANRVDWPTLKRVVDRATLIEDIQTAATPPVDYGRLAHLLPSARALGLAGDPRFGDLDLATLERQIIRAAHVRRLRAALTRGDDAAIAMAADPDPYGAVATLEPDEQLRIDRALQTRRRLPMTSSV